MAPIHHIMAHFPIALLSLAFLLILLRSLNVGDLGRRLESAVLMYLLALGIAGGIAALITGLLIWPLDATLSSTMGRNKLLMATWTLSVWSLILLLRWRVGEAIWAGQSRFLLLGLGVFGAILLATTGTLGGHLLGSPSRFSGLLHQFGWSVYQTYYVPTWVLWIMIAASGSGVVAGMLAGANRGVAVPTAARSTLVTPEEPAAT